MALPKRVALSDVAVIEREIVDSAAIETGTLYVGLENIESGGRFVGVRPVDAGELASSKFAFTPQHLLYGKLRPYLAKIARPDFKGICSTDILPVLPGPDLDRSYLAWLLLTPEMVALANSRATGANLPRLSPTSLAELRIPLPPLPEQRRIAEILDKADALRAKRRAALAQLDTLTQSIFLDMFGDPSTNSKEWLVAPLSELADIGSGLTKGR
jgi:type I restriction enzyme S subunit